MKSLLAAGKALLNWSIFWYKIECCECK